MKKIVFCSIMLFSLVLIGCTRTSLVHIEQPCDLFDGEDMKKLFNFTGDVAVTSLSQLPYHLCEFTTPDGVINVRYYMDPDGEEEFLELPLEHGMVVEHLGDQAYWFKNSREMTILYRNNFFFIRFVSVDGGISAAKKLANELVDIFR